MLTSWLTVKPGGVSASSAGTLQKARRIPSPAPVTDSSTLSVSNWRMMRFLPAPSAARSAISRPLPDARASRRFAVLAQAIRSRSPTAPNIMSRGSATELDKSSRRGANADGSSFRTISIGKAVLVASQTGAAAPLACSIDMPGDNRATT